MRTTLFIGLTILAGLYSFDAFGLQSRKIVASAGAPIPTSYSYSNSQSLAWSEISDHRHFSLQNTTSSAIACLPNGGNTTEPEPQNAATGVSEEIYLPATTQLVFDDITVGDHVYCRSDSGTAITSGQILLHVW